MTQVLQEHLDSIRDHKPECVWFGMKQVSNGVDLTSPYTTLKLRFRLSLARMLSESTHERPEIVVHIE